MCRQPQNNTPKSRLLATDATSAQFGLERPNNNDGPFFLLLLLVQLIVVAIETHKGNATEEE